MLRTEFIRTRTWLRLEVVGSVMREDNNLLVVWKIVIGVSSQDVEAVQKMVGMEFYEILARIVGPFHCCI